MEPCGLDLSSVLLISMIGLFSLAFGSVLIFNVYQRRMLSKDRELQQRETQYQRELLSAIIESQEMERKRIAHDLHDEIGVLLSTSKIYFNQLSPDKAEKQFGELRNRMNGLFDEMMVNIRRISHDLRPVILEKLGLVEALESLGAKLCDSGMKFYFHQNAPIPLSQHAELLIYRIIQELITNTIRHSKGDTIWLTLEGNLQHLLLHYKDNGLGMPMHPGKGLGMKSIESRLRILDGHLEHRKTEKGVYFLITLAYDNLQVK